MAMTDLRKRMQEGRKKDLGEESKHDIIFRVNFQGMITNLKG